jgi:hypothetical protein
MHRTLRRPVAAISTITRHLLDWRPGDEIALSRLSEEVYVDSVAWLVR